MKKLFNQSEVVKIVFFAVLLSLTIIVYDWPIFSKINKFYSGLKAEAGALEAQHQQGNSFTKVFLDYEQFQAKLPAIENLLKKNGQELDLIKELETAAAGNDLEQELTLSQTRQPWSEKIDQLALSVKLQGSFKNLISYLTELEKNNFQLIVESISLKPADVLGQPAAAEIEAQLLLNTYWLKQ